MRVTVAMIVGQIGYGRSIDSPLVDYPYLEREDILQAVRYAAWLPKLRITPQGQSEPVARIADHEEVAGRAH
jgi:uncharacterized protein (DUF433 family)